MNDFSKIVEVTKSMRLLYVEDNETTRDSTVEIFKKIFLEVVIAVDGEDGMEKFYENEIDIIISDIEMPRLGGFDMIERIRNIDKDMPILLLSGHDKTEYFRKSIQLNVDGYILKPFELSELMEALNKIVQKIKFQEDFNNNILFLEQYQELTDSSSAVSKTDPKGVITYINDEFTKISGYTKDELLGKKHNLLRHPDNPASIYTDMWHTIKYEKKPWKGVIRNITKDGSTCYTDMVIKPILDKENNVVEYISTKIDVTDVMNPNKQLHDFLESSVEPFLVYIKIEGFSDIEKFYGYNISQKINDDFALVLKKYIPKKLNLNKIFSLGEGYFAFIKDLGSDFKNYTAEESKECIDSLVDELKNFQDIINELNIDVENLDYDMSIVISVASGKDCLENVKYGMRAILKDKQDFIVANNFAKIEQENAEKNLTVLKMVKNAIDNSNVISYFQPIVCNKSQDVLKYESLVRIIGEDGNIISPYIFLDIAKKGKYYSRITSIVLENSFKALEKTDKSISINISVLDIEKSSTRDKIFELLQLHRESTNRVIFELLEDEDVKNFNLISKFISEVKKYDVKIAIDDFGIGYSNFARLLDYQPDILKIDGSLIKNIESDSYSLSIVKTIVSFAKEQKIEMVAEFVENEKIYDILKGLGVEYSQGYYFGAPALME